MKGKSWYRIALVVVALFIGTSTWIAPAKSLAWGQEVEPPDTALVMSPEVRASIMSRWIYWSRGERPLALGCMMGEYIGSWQIRVDSVIWSQDVCPGSIALVFLSAEAPPPQLVCPLLSRIHLFYPEIHSVEVVYGIKADGRGFRSFGCIFREQEPLPSLPGTGGS